MKKYIRIALSFVLGLSTASCDFLNEEPRTSLTDGVAFSSESALESNIAALYVSASSIYGSSTIQHDFGSAARDVCYRGDRRGLNDNYDGIQDLTLYSKGSVNATIFRNIYNGINRCNTLIDGLSGSSVDEDYKKEIEAEAKFFRATFYFYGVRIWGNIPLMKTHPTTTEETCIPRAMYNEIYKFILEDLEYAEKYMRTKERQETVNPGMSRVYKGAATFTKALVYMQMASYLKAEASNPGFGEIPLGTVATGELKPDFTNCGINSAEEAWQKCLDACNEVIDSKVYSLESDYRHLFRWDSAHHPEDYSSKERIFAIPVTSNSATDNGCAYFIPDYLVRSDGSYPTIHNGNQGRLHGQRWVWEEWSKKYGGSPKNVSATVTEFDADGNQLSLKKTYEVYTISPDPRQDATFLHDSYTYFDLGSTNTYKTKSIYPSAYVGTSYTSPGVISSQDGGFWMKKYTSLTYNGTETGDADVYVYRLAEVYLTAAEACANLAKYKEAVDFVNVILERARKSTDGAEAAEPKAWEYADYADEPTLTNAIAWEREFELLAEGGTHWMDEHRHGVTWLSEWLCKPLNVFINKEVNGSHKLQCYYGQDIPSDPTYLKACLFGAYPDYDLRYNTALDPEQDQNVHIRK